MTNTKYNTLFKNSHKQQQEQTNCQSNKATFLPHIDHSTVFARWCQRGGTRWCLVIHSSLVQNQSATHPMGIFIGSSVSAGITGVFNIDQSCNISFPAYLPAGCFTQKLRDIVSHHRHHHLLDAHTN